VRLRKNVDQHSEHLNLEDLGGFRSRGEEVCVPGASRCGQLARGLAHGFVQRHAGGRSVPKAPMKASPAPEVSFCPTGMAEQCVGPLPVYQQRSALAQGDNHRGAFAAQQGASRACTLAGHRRHSRQGRQLGSFGNDDVGSENEIVEAGSAAGAGLKIVRTPAAWATRRGGVNRFQRHFELAEQDRGGANGFRGCGTSSKRQQRMWRPEPRRCYCGLRHRRESRRGTRAAVGDPDLRRVHTLNAEVVDHAVAEDIVAYRDHLNVKRPAGPPSRPGWRLCLRSRSGTTGPRASRPAAADSRHRKRQIDVARSNHDKMPVLHADILSSADFADCADLTQINGFSNLP